MILTPHAYVMWQSFGLMAQQKVLKSIAFVTNVGTLNAKQNLPPRLSLFKIRVRRGKARGRHRESKVLQKQRQTSNFGEVFFLLI